MTEDARHECFFQEDQNISAAQVLTKHISNKSGLRYDMPPNVRRPCGWRQNAAEPKVTFSFATTLMDKIGLCACGSTPKPYYAMCSDVTRLWTWSLVLE